MNLRTRIHMHLAFIRANKSLAVLSITLVIALRLPQS